MYNNELMSILISWGIDMFVSEKASFLTIPSLLKFRRVIPLKFSDSHGHLDFLRVA